MSGLDKIVIFSFILFVLIELAEAGGLKEVQEKLVQKNVKKNNKIKIEDVKQSVVNGDLKDEFKDEDIAEDVFNGCDFNLDGELEGEEIDVFESFLAVEDGGDGKISPGEMNQNLHFITDFNTYVSILKKKESTFFELLNVNGDGDVDSEEWGLGYWFAKLDENGDGNVEKSEFEKKL